MEKKKRKKKVSKANSVRNEAKRYGRQVLGLYQQYLEGDSEPNVTSLQPETHGGQRIKPVLVTP